MKPTLPDALRPRNFLRIDHLGIAVPSLEAFVPVYEALLGTPCEHIEDVPSEKVRTAFFSLGESHFELLEPTDPDSVIGRFVAQRKGGIHHICIAVSDIQAALDAYAAQGVRLIDRVPRPGAKGCQVAFVHPAGTGGVLIELSQGPHDVA
jgi:methylmalonyl-CoA/ethylmalonyl-CoA epimerase